MRRGRDRSGDVLYRLQGKAFHAILTAGRAFVCCGRKDTRDNRYAEPELYQKKQRNHRRLQISRHSGRASTAEATSVRASCRSPSRSSPGPFGRSAFPLPHWSLADPVRPVLGAVELLRHQLPKPRQDGVGCGDQGHFLQALPAQPLAISSSVDRSALERRRRTGVAYVPAGSGSRGRYSMCGRSS